MRIAHVLPDGSATSIVALEWDGSLYDVAELDRWYETPYAPERLPASSDFHTRVIALGCAGLSHLDAKLRIGKAAALATRLSPGTFRWLPPCATPSAAYVQMAPYDANVTEPHYWYGLARGMLGHESLVPFPFGEAEPDFEVGVAAILGEDLANSTPSEAERAILGYAIVTDWTATERRERCVAAGFGLARAKDFATQLGPVLVTKDEIPNIADLPMRIRLSASPKDPSRSGDIVTVGTIGEWRFSLAESIVYVSEQAPLKAGDVIGAGRVLGGHGGGASGRPSYGSILQVAVERIGTLAGRPVRTLAPSR